MDGLLRCPRLLVVCRGSWPSISVCGLMSRKASMTTFPFTLCTGSTTTATARTLSCSKLYASRQRSRREKPAAAAAIWAGRRVGQLQKAAYLLRINVHPREPATEPGVAVIPPHHHLRPAAPAILSKATYVRTSVGPLVVERSAPAGLLQHVKHLCLEDGVHRLHTDPRSALWHCEHVDHLHLRDSFKGVKPRAADPGGQNEGRTGYSGARRELCCTRQNPKIRKKRKVRAV